MLKQVQHDSFIELLSTKLLIKIQRTQIRRTPKRDSHHTQYKDTKKGPYKGPFLVSGHEETRTPTLSH